MSGSLAERANSDDEVVEEGVFGRPWYDLEVFFDDLVAC